MYICTLVKTCYIHNCNKCLNKIVIIIHLSKLLSIQFTNFRPKNYASTFLVTTICWKNTTCVRRRGGTRYPGSNAKFDTGLQEAETIERPLPETGNGSLKMYSSEWVTRMLLSGDWRTSIRRTSTGKRAQGGGDAWKMIARALVHWKISVEAKRETLTWLVITLTELENQIRISWMNNDETGRWMILLCSRSFYGIFVSLGCYVINFV